MATTANGNDGTNTEAIAAANKPKRVRTGCLTCRERHLKCDEAAPVCNNCRKSARVCKRGIRLNFIDTTCNTPPVIPETDQWNVGFIDESREIAAEYRGGAGRYTALEADPVVQQDGSMLFDYTGTGGQTLQPASLPSIHGMIPEAQQDDAQAMSMFEQQKEYKDFQQHSQGHPSSTYSNSTVPHQQSPFEKVPQVIPVEPKETRQIIDSQEETLFMQVFVEEVAIWMDSMDSMKHFSRLLPFHALEEPMLLNAFFACGCRHLTLVNPAVYQEEKALNYYDNASGYLLRALENPHRNSVICAVTAVILNVYEIMTEKALPRMNHIAGARALIKECNWDARSNGIGSACFWINVGMELLSNLRFNWQPSWHPDSWGVDLDFTPDTEPGREEIWTHRMVYITAKVGEFRATIPRTHDASPRNEQLRRQKRMEEWLQLKGMADSWNQNIPRTMHPLAYLYPYQTTSKSAFPEVWLVKRATIVARLFYHTAMCLLAQIHPIMPITTPEMHEMESHHAHQICGIAAHVKDRGVASVALRSLHIAAETLTIRREQEEVMQIFTRIHRETGWRLGFIPVELSEKWGWETVAQAQQLPTHTVLANGNSMQGIQNTAQTPQYQQYQFDQYADMQQRLQHQQQAQQAHLQQHRQQQQQLSPPTAPPPVNKKPPQGIVNPLFATADFSLAKHPYQDVYVAPALNHGQHQLPGIGGGQTLGLPAMYPPVPGHDPLHY